MKILRQKEFAKGKVYPYTLEEKSTIELCHVDDNGTTYPTEKGLKVIDSITSSPNYNGKHGWESEDKKHETLVSQGVNPDVNSAEYVCVSSRV